MLNALKARDSKALILVGMAILYSIGVIYADILFLGIVNRAFPSGPLSTLATVGAFLTGAFALLLPLAIHYYFSPGKQDTLGKVCYGLDMAILIANAILGYQLSKGSPSGILASWYAICPATPVFDVAMIGVLWLVDPSHILRHHQRAVEYAQIEQIALGMHQGMNDPDTQEYLQALGRASIRSKATEMTHLVLPMPGNKNSHVVDSTLAEGNKNSHQEEAKSKDPLFSRVKGHRKGEGNIPGKNTSDLLETEPLPVQGEDMIGK